MINLPTWDESANQKLKRDKSANHKPISILVSYTTNKQHSKQLRCHFKLDCKVSVPKQTTLGPILLL